MLPGDVGQRLPPHFFLLPSYWRPWRPRAAAAKSAAHTATDASLGGAEPLLGGGAHRANFGAEDGGHPAGGGGGGGGGVVAVAVRGLRRDFSTTDGGVKRALDGLTLDVYADQVTALLGAPTRSLTVWGMQFCKQPMLLAGAPLPEG